MSVAGKRAGLAGERSGLFWEIIRIAKETKPSWGLFENVPGLLSSNGGRDMWTVLNGLRECWPVVGYRILNSQYFGVAQRRRRVFFVCGPTESSVQQVFFEPEGSGWHLTPSREAGENVARYLATETNGARYDGGSEEFVVTAHTLTGEGHDASEDGTGRGIPLCFHPKASITQSMNLSTLSPSLLATKEVGVFHHGVRRLTPVEAERLQGFPDGWTCLCQQIEAYREDPDASHFTCSCSDSPRYRALGNAVTVNVIEWIGNRLQGIGL